MFTKIILQLMPVSWSITSTYVDLIVVGCDWCLLNCYGNWIKFLILETKLYFTFWLSKWNDKAFFTIITLYGKKTQHRWNSISFISYHRILFCELQKGCLSSNGDFCIIRYLIIRNSTCCDHHLSHDIFFKHILFVIRFSCPHNPMNGQ